MPAKRVDASEWEKWSVSSVLLGGRTFRGGEKFYRCGYQTQENIYISRVWDGKKETECNIWLINAKIHKEDQQKGVHHSPALRMVKIPREGPGDVRNTIMWDKGQGHPRAYRARAGLVAATITLRKWNLRLHMEVRTRLFNCGDERVAACSILRATRLSLDDCVYKWNTKQYMGECVRATIFRLSPYAINSLRWWQSCTRGT
jgi:hypothetical protein